MTEIRALTPGQRIRADRVRARRRAEEAARVEAEAEKAPRRTVFERERPANDDAAGFAPDLQLHAQMSAEHRRGLRAGPQIHGAARRTYLGTEYAGPADRRARLGRRVSTSV